VPFNGLLDEVRVTARDIDDFLADINGALPEARLTRDDVRYSFCGIYPLIASEVRADTYQGTGEYQVIDHGRANGVDGIITALGAKYTTARRVAEQAVDLAAARLGRSGAGCRTAVEQLAEGAIDDIETFRQDCRRRYREDLEPATIDELVRNHGLGVHELVEMGRERDLLQPLAPDRPTLAVEVAHAVQGEMALTLDDLLFRRTGLGTIGHPGEAALARCADLMGALLGWDAAEKARQIAAVNSRYAYP
jgi:glycerol-3-phosphate dehydrogenase